MPNENKTNRKKNNIFKYIICGFIFLAVICLLIILDNTNSRKQTITKKEWITQLQSSLGVELIEMESASDKPATGDYVAYTSMKAVTIADSESSEEPKGINRDMYCQMAIDNGFVSRSLIDEDFTQAAAEKVISNIFEYLYDFEHVETYDETVYKEGVLNADNIEEYTYYEDENKIVMSTVNEIPQVGNYIVVKDKYGCAIAKKIADVKSAGTNKYVIECDEISDLSEIASKISFSGFAAYNSPFAQEKQMYYEQDNSIKTEGLGDFISDIGKIGSTIINTGASIIDGVHKIINKEPIYAEKTISDIGISFLLDFEKGEVEGTYDIGDDNVTYKIDKDGKFKEVTSTYYLPDYKKEEEKKKHKELDTDPDKSKYFEGSINIEELILSASYYYNYDNVNDRNNKAIVECKCDYDTEVSCGFEVSNKLYLICSLSIPIPHTPADVKVDFYLNFSAKGEVTITYRTRNAGFKVGVENSKPIFDFNKGSGDNSHPFSAEISAEVGAPFDLCLEVFKISVLSPTFTPSVLLEAQILPAAEGYEKLPQCKQVNIYPFLLEFEISAEKTLVGFALKFFGVNKISIFDKDNTPFRIERHYEYLSSGKQTDESPLKGKSEDVCTHIKKGKIQLDDEKTDKSKDKNSKTNIVDNPYAKEYHALTNKNFTEDEFIDFFVSLSDINHTWTYWYGDIFRDDSSDEVFYEESALTKTEIKDLKNLYLLLSCFYCDDYLNKCFTDDRFINPNGGVGGKVSTFNIFEKNGVLYNNLGTGFGGVYADYISDVSISSVSDTEYNVALSYDSYFDNGIEPRSYRLIYENGMWKLNEFMDGYMEIDSSTTYSIH